MFFELPLAFVAGVVVGGLCTALFFRWRIKQLTVDQFVSQLLPQLDWYALLSQVINNVTNREHKSVWPEIGDYLRRKADAKMFDRSTATP